MKSTAVLVVLTLSLLAQPGWADKRAFTLEDLYQLKSVADPQISPDGQRIAFVITSYDLAQGTSDQDIYVMDARGGDIRPFVSSDQQDYHPRWSPDGDATDVRVGSQ